MRRILCASVFALTSLLVVAPPPASAATAASYWACDIQGPVTRQVIYDHFGPNTEVWRLRLSGTCTSADGRRATLSAQSVYDSWIAPTPGLCDDVGVLPPFNLGAFMGSQLTTNDGRSVTIYHNWSIASAVSASVGGPVSTVAVGGNVYPTGPDSPNLTGSGIAFARIFGQCPPPDPATHTTNARFLLGLVETRVV